MRETEPITHQDPDIVTFQRVNGVGNHAHYQPRITSTMPDGGEISSALLDKCRRREGKLKITAARAAEKVPSR